MDAGDDFLELVWENGQILTRGRTTCNPSSIDYSSRHPKPKTNSTTDNGDICPRKKSRLRTLDSAMFSPSSHQEFAKDDERSLRDDYRRVFRSFMDQTRDNTHDKYLNEPQIVPVCQDENSKPVNTSEVEIPQVTKSRNDQLYHQSTSHYCQVSAPFRRSIMNASQSQSSMGGLPDSDWQQLKSSGRDKQLALRNFSLFSRPEGDPSSSRVPELKISETEKLPRALFKPETGSENAKESYKCEDLMTTDMDQIRQIKIPPKEPILDEQSETPVYSKRVLDPTSGMKTSTTDRKPDAGNSTDQLAAATSTCSRGASNDLPHSFLKRKYGNVEEMISSSENSDEEQRVPKSVSVRAGSKKGKTPEVYKLSRKKKKRNKISKKMRALRALVPNSHKVDEASMLDNTIEYIKTLQLQHQILSMGSNLCIPPMMIPTTLQQTQAPPHLVHFSPVGVGMGITMPLAPLPFTNSPILGLTTSQILPMPMASEPLFNPFLGGIVPFSGAVATPREFMRSAQTTQMSTQK